MPTPKKLKASEKRTFKLLEEFDEAARWWGWEQDQGTGKSVERSEEQYNAAKEALIQHLNRLHNRLRFPKVIIREV